MIVVVSDLHLGYKESDTAAFTSFVSDYVSKELCGEDHFVLLGDIFDFWRRRNIEPLLEHQGVLTEILGLDAKVWYVVGNHDYYMLKIRERFPEYYVFDLRKNLRLADGGNRFFFTHGYELDVLANYEPLTIENYEKICESLCRAENILGKIMSRLWGLRKKLGKPPEKRKSWRKLDIDKLEEFACSNVRNIFLGMRNDEKLVFGHTHRPFIREDTANTGSWVRSPQRYNTFIEIKNGKMKLKKW
ncbi:MAG: hypothetical protein DRI61_16365 [Chloroflexi bacterium]|nr:MAG: hypothetical protein DRI61_16365 [Chloroflexota bacterium]